MDTIEYKTTERLHAEIDRLWDCANAMSTDYDGLVRAINCASGAINVEDTAGIKPTLATQWKTEADKRLAEIEDAIKRYWENRPQSYQEEPEEATK